MPKRPCAIALASDGKLIIAADKFGDVYSLPLLPTPEEDEAARLAVKPAPKAFAPTATDLTVHSRANRKALESQLKHAKENPQTGTKDAPKIKEPLAFAHELLLGHVSMLTDVVIAELPAGNGEQKTRKYILTSDRDEHIRVSRGPPQAYVIEGFCLGHHEFITKLCLVRPDLLVSGGGEPDLFVWDWLKGQVVSRINVSGPVSDVRKNEKEQESGEGAENSGVIISGIWLYPGPSEETVSSQQSNQSSYRNILLTVYTSPQS
jgi:tRNA (guanine-N(7)-)-methyltransferase subunit TRM82